MQLISNFIFINSLIEMFALRIIFFAESTLFVSVENLPGKKIRIVLFFRMVVSFIQTEMLFFPGKN